MQTPKILPWIARKAGISDIQAEKLWRRAQGEAQAATGSTDGAEYHRMAVERFLDMAEAASGGLVRNGYAESPTKVSWIWRHQGRMAMFSLIAAENAARFWNNTFQDLWSVTQQAPRRANAGKGCPR